MKTTLLITSAMLLWASAAMAADTLIGNLDAYNNSDTGSSIYAPAASPSGDSTGRAVGFTMGDTAFLLESVSLRLKLGTGATTASPSIEFWSSNQSDPRLPGTLISSLTNMSGTLNQSTYNTVSFSTDSIIELAANTTYYIIVRSTEGMFYWSAGNPVVAPTSDFGVSFNNTLWAGRNQTDPATWSNTSGNTNWFSVQAPSIPEGRSSAVIFSMTAVAVLAFVGLRRRAAR